MKTRHPTGPYRRLSAVMVTLASVAGAWHLRPPLSSAAPAPEAAGRTPTVTFTRDVAPIIFAKCSTCHHPGEAAPFSLLSYEDVRKRARQIVDVTHQRFMPPWLPAVGKNDFVGARELTAEELATLAGWVEAGAPRGDPGELPPAPTFVDGWQGGTPDLVLESPAYTLASQEQDVFRNFVIPIKLDSPRWIQSIELRPDNPRVTHHARMGVDSSNESARRDAEDPEPGYAGMAWAQDPEGQLVIWAPGMVANPGTPGVAWRLYPKSDLVLHTHMQPSGKPEIVKFHIGVRFAKRAPEKNPVMLRIGTCDIDIPAGAKHHVVTDAYVLPVDVDVQTIFPHAHSLCSELHVSAELPDGSRTSLIQIDRFDENWHDMYRYRQPIRLPAGARLVSTFAYDNTDGNVRNRHHPARRVVYGSNADDEMADVYLQVTPVRADQRAALLENCRRYDMREQLVGYARSLDAYPDNPWLLEGLATCYVGLGDPGKAIATLEQRIRTGPAEVYPVVSLGMSLLAKGDAPGAEAQLRRATTMDAAYPLAWFGLGKALAVERRPDEAELAFRRAADLAPGLVDARLNLADLLVAKGQYEEASKLCLSTLDDTPDAAGVYVKLGDIQARQKRYDQAIAYYEQARRAAPYTHPAKVLLAVACAGVGDLPRATALLQEARSENPRHPVPALILGQLACRQKQADAARSLLSAAAALPLPDNWPESHRTRFLVLLHSERFRLAQQLDDLELARDALTQWQKQEPANTQVRSLLQGFPPAR